MQVHLTQQNTTYFLNTLWNYFPNSKFISAIIYLYLKYSNIQANDVGKIAKRNKRKGLTEDQGTSFHPSPYHYVLHTGI